MNRDLLLRQQDRTNTLKPGASSPTGKSTLVEAVARKAAGPDDGVQAHAGEAVDRAAQSKGVPLPPDLKEQFESSLGADLSGVRLHTGSSSAAAAESLSARAYTVGQDVHFNADELDPRSSDGQHLLAHEVAHTVQQRDGVAAPQLELQVSTPGDAHEREADHAAEAMLAGAPARVSPAGAGIARDKKKDVANLHAQDKAGEQAGNDAAGDSESQAIGKASFIKDNNDALGALTDINAGTSSITSVIGNDDRAGQYLGTNMNTMFKVQQYIQTISKGQRGLGTFQGAFMSAKKDYGRVQGMAQQYLQQKGAQSNGDTAANQAVCATMKLDGLEQDKEKAQDKGKFMTKFSDFQKLRTQLATQEANIPVAEAAMNAAGQVLQNQLYAVQGAAAGEKVEKATNELALLNQEINEGAEWVSSVLEVAATVAGGMGGGAVAAEGAAAEGAGEAAAGESAGATFKETTEKWNGISGMIKKVTGIDLSPAGLTTTIMTALSRERIGAIKNTIASATKEKELNMAAAQAGVLDVLKQDFINKATAYAKNLTNFANIQTDLRSMAEELSGEAVNDSGDPNLAFAIKFLADAEVFESQVELAIQMGQSETQTGEQMSDSRMDLALGRITYYSAEKREESISGEDQVTIKNNVVEFSEDKAAHERSEQDYFSGSGDGGGGQMNFDPSGAQTSLSVAMAQLKGMQAEIKVLRDLVQDNMHAKTSHLDVTMQAP
jgi:hypothetical protein